MKKYLISSGTLSAVAYLVATSVVVAQDTYKVIGEQTYMAAESSFFWGVKWVPRSVDGIAIIENGTVKSQWDSLPREYPADWVTDLGGGNCRATHEKLPPGLVFTYRVSDGTKFYEINTKTRRKSYIKFKCAK